MRFCPVCQAASADFAPGPNGRPQARCPRCGSLERHRFAAVVLQGLAPYIAAGTAVLDVAPSEAVTTQLQRLRPRRYVRMDLDPAADERNVDVQASLTHMPFADATFDLVVCLHVLEHVPDDARGMRELGRVLRPGGMALVQVPWRPWKATDEDPDAPEAIRVRRFGQADHVRYYGADFEDRLQAAGLGFLRMRAGDLVGDALCDALGLMRDEVAWIVRRGGEAVPDGGHTLHATLHGAYAGFPVPVDGRAPTWRHRLRRRTTS